MTAQHTIPSAGLYVSKQDPSVRLIVTDVIVVDEQQEDAGDIFYLVYANHDDDKGDMYEPGYELLPEEWQEFTKLNQLEFIPEREMSIAELRQLLDGS
ncbi:hypothetical protein [Pantoea cypripedii]|uniref:DUF1292 domain-containing protein n=1 Tax=Pantoea cypripedii TaxID=55209 RepID=A0A1X1ET31_PANCY|nr:hypothetical protein [Pantoea cypripedii]MBP2197244.1 hypothetical protein [Pantoea cypripedii]ORM93166.1 hypothetical protein HA50_07340 [Pantoea cypripedii]